MHSVSWEAVRQHFLHKQCLTAPGPDVASVTERMLGCRAAEGSTPYLSYWWRVTGFQAADFDRAVHEDRTLLRVRGPRGTYFWVTSRLAPLFLAAALPEPEDEYFAKWAIQPREREAIKEEIRACLSGGRLSKLAEIKKALSPRLDQPVYRKGERPSTSIAVTLEFMQRMGEITALKEPGFTRHRAAEYHGDARDVTRPNLFGLVSELYPEVQFEEVNQHDARRQLMLAYIQRYGPVTTEDIVWWTGWTKREVVGHLDGLMSALAEVRIEGLTHWMHGDDLQALHVASRPMADHFCLLPGGDSAMKGYDRFQRFLASPTHDHNVLRFMPAVVHNGVGLGNWAYRLTLAGISMVVQPFMELDDDQEERLTAIASSFGRYLCQSESAKVQLEVVSRTGPWHSRQAYPLHGS